MKELEVELRERVRKSPLERTLRSARDESHQDELNLSASAVRIVNCNTNQK